MTEDEQPGDGEYIQALENEVKALQGKNTDLSTGMSSSRVNQKDPNLISLQLETPELLQKLERFYRGEYLHTDETTGNITWKVPENKDLVPLNEFGVSLLMEIVTKYIDKNTVLSNYKEDRIFEIIGDIGDELILVIYCNYEKMGMDTPFKKTKFRLIITTTLHLIESAYRRAIDGNTFHRLNESKIVTQSDSINSNSGGQVFAQKRRFSPVDPRTWGHR